MSGDVGGERRASPRFAAFFALGILGLGKVDPRFAAPGGGRDGLWLLGLAGLALVASVGVVVLALRLAQHRRQLRRLEAGIAARTSELERANAHLRAEMADRERKGALQTAIYRITEATHTMGDLPDLYRRLHEVIATLMPAKNFFIALHDPVENTLSFPYYADEKSGPPATRPWSLGLSEYVIRTRQPFLGDEARVAALVAQGEVCQIGPVAALWLGVPLIVHGRAMGVIALQEYDRPISLNQEHQQILTYVAGQMATAIERKRAEAELRRSREELSASQQRFRGAFAGSPAIMTLARLHDGTIFEVNDAFLSTTGYRRDEVLGRSTIELGIWVHAEDRDALIQAVRQGGSVRDREVSVRMKDGRLRTVLLAAELVEIDGEPSILTASLDVSERKEIEEQLRLALAREKELGELKSNFVSLVSHEFRTPLEVILSSAEILERYHDRLAPEQRGRQLRAIQRSVRRMAEMMNEVLLLGRFEAGRVEFRPVPIDLPAFQRRLRDEIVAASGTDARIETSHEGPLAGARGDESLLGHVFSNLLSNAVKYSPAGVPVAFTVRREGEAAVFEVRDRGCGIPEGDRQRLFQSFHRGSNVGQRSGTGLGLVIVKRCVERHGGTVSFASREGEGSTFTVRLPLFGRDPGEAGPAPAEEHEPVRVAVPGPLSN